MTDQLLLSPVLTGILPRTQSRFRSKVEKLYTPGAVSLWAGMTRESDGEWRYTPPYISLTHTVTVGLLRFSNDETTEPQLYEKVELSLDDVIRKHGL